MLHARTSLFAALALATAGTLGFAQSQSVTEGDRPSFDFRRPLMNGRGVSSLADFGGKPVLVEFWGTR